MPGFLAKIARISLVRQFANLDEMHVGQRCKITSLQTLAYELGVVSKIDLTDEYIHLNINFPGHSTFDYSYRAMPDLGFLQPSGTYKYYGVYNIQIIQG